MCPGGKREPETSPSTLLRVGVSGCFCDVGVRRGRARCVLGSDHFKGCRRGPLLALTHHRSQPGRRGGTGWSWRPIFCGGLARVLGVPGLSVPPGGHKAGASLTCPHISIWAWEAESCRRGFPTAPGSSPGLKLPLQGFEKPWQELSSAAAIPRVTIALRMMLRGGLRTEGFGWSLDRLAKCFFPSAPPFLSHAGSFQDGKRWHEGSIRRVRCLSSRRG